MTILLDNVATDQVSDPPFISKGGTHLINIRGDMDGGSITVEVASPNDVSDRFVTLSNGLFTAAVSKTLDFLPNGMRLRVTLAGAGGGASAVFCDIL